MVVSDDDPWPRDPCASPVTQASLNNVAGGTLKLKDELKFTFDIVARKQE
jgi:hypothetical protein